VPNAEAPGPIGKFPIAFRRLRAHSRRAAILLALSIIIGLLAIVEYQNFTGYCHRESRYLTDRELLESAINFIIELDKRRGEEITYNSPQELLDNNQDCCSLFKDGHSHLPEGIWVRFFGWYVAVAEIWYKARNGRPSYSRAEISIDACGKILEHFRNVESIPPGIRSK
jgi:hypothetical protein